MITWGWWRFVGRPMVPYCPLEGQAIVISGSDYGFGKAFAVALYDLGATVYAGCLSEASAEKLRKQCSGGPGKMMPLVMDVTKDDDVADAAEVVKKSGLPVRALINNAGISAFGWAEMLPLRRYQRNMEVNFFGTVRLTQAFLPMIRASQGRVVNIGSIGARMPSSFGSAYLSTKSAMVSYSECVRQEVFRFGVRVITVEPGFFETELLANGSNNGSTDSGNDAEVLSAYPSYAEKMEKTAEPIRNLEKLNGGKEGLRHVTNCVIDACRSPVPLTRYTVGWDAKLIRHVLVFAPAWLIDRVQTAQG
mmetsp:Transcript_64655/g.179598  ORF Transcript_64655/g.179598 Transcript_64655/m.179598 type:complete len:306 (-) Transcript_64655:128-1045(-)